MLELQEVLENCGFRVGAMVTAIAEHSVERTVAANRPDSKDIDELTKFAKEIKEKFNSGDINTELKPKGNKPYREYNGIPLKPKDLVHVMDVEYVPQFVPWGQFLRKILKK